MKNLKEFKINNFINLRLENEITYLYVGNERFEQCNQLLFEIHEYKKESFNEINSIDEFEGKLRTWSKSDIPPEDEFWGHCSNLQTWAEHNYDTRLLHRNLAFPLLKKLVHAGDLVAKRVFKEEIATRFSSAYPTVVSFLVKEEYLDFMNNEELDFLIEELFTARFIYALQRLVRNFYSKLRRYIKKKNFENLLLNFYEEVISLKNPALEIMGWNIVQKIISIELLNKFPVEKDKYILWFEKENGIESIKTLRLSEKKNKTMMDINEVFGWKILGGLKFLTLDHFKISNFSYFENCVELIELDMNNCEIESIKGIEKLENLKSINIFNCYFPKIYNFGNLENLTELQLEKCSINEIMGLRGLNNLETLALSRNQIDNIKGFDSLKNLKKLILNYNIIHEIKGLENLVNLNELDLASNKIAKIENLDKLNQLKILFLSFNKISNIENLENLSNLERLYLGYNQIEDKSYLEKLKSLQYVSLKGNNLTK